MSNALGLFQALGLFTLLSSVLITAHPAHVLERSSPRSSLIVPLRKNVHYRRNGGKEYTRALLKYGVDLPDHLSKLASSSQATTTSSTTSVVARNTSSDREYTSPVGFGTPPQVMFLDFDTGSADTWIFSTETLSAKSSNHSVWHPELSTSATKLNGSSWMINYGDGTTAGGNVWQDTIHIGGIQIDNAIVETAVFASNIMVKDPYMDGLLGLAYNHSSTVKPSQPGVLDDLYDQGIDVFQCDLRYHEPGFYSFGPVNTTLIPGLISYQPVNGTTMFWTIDLTTLQIGGTNVKLIHSWPAVIDTGTTLALIPDDLVALYYAQVPNVSYSETNGGWVFPCNQTDTLPDFIFGFANDGSEYTVPGRYMNYIPVDDGELCYGGIQSNQGLPFMLIGDLFLKAVHVIFDRTMPAVGFATKDLST